MLTATTVTGSVDQDDMLSITDSAGAGAMVPAEMLRMYMRGEGKDVTFELYAVAKALYSQGIGPNDTAAISAALASGVGIIY